MLVKILSDTHNKHNELDVGEGDILIHCGDATNDGKYQETMRFFKWFNRQNFKYKIFVAGNHDRMFKPKNVSTKSYQDVVQFCEDTGIIRLDHNHAVINGTLFYGGGYTPYWRDGVNLGEVIRLENNLPDPYNNIDPNTAVLITHSPPLGILDVNSRGEHIGCPLLLEAVKKLKPNIHMFGHVHEHNGKKLSFDAMTYMNCCNLDLGHNVQRNYTEVHI